MHINIKQRQSGAALIIGLVLLAILTLLTASSMNSSTVSLRMADNVKQAGLAFQAAESALADSLNFGPALALTNDSVPDQIIQRNDADHEAYSYEVISGDPSSMVDVQVTTRFKDALQPLLGTDLGLNLHFELQADSTAGRGARSSHRQGFFVFAPSN